MSAAKLSLACGLAAVSLCGCGIAQKPIAGTSKLASRPGNHAKVDDPRIQHLTCMLQAGLQARPFTASGGRPGIQVGGPPGGPTIVFYATPGAAQALQISGEAQAAEVIGNALLYPNVGSDKELSTIEGCLAIGVPG
ncbi:MAG: hypothetical protein ACLP01_15995 [Solirubrobacteraceae bacterium]